MKKKWLIIPAAILAIGIGTAGVLTNAVFTGNPDNIVYERQQNCFGNCNGGNYSDENNDGVCDNYSEGKCQQNGSGNGKHRGNGCHHR